MCLIGFCQEEAVGFGHESGDRLAPRAGREGRVPDRRFVMTKAGGRRPAQRHPLRTQFCPILSSFWVLDALVKVQVLS
jgi:hypothetical protein